MNKSVILIMGGALLVAILVALFVQARLSPSSDGAAPATVEILVANKQLLVGQNLKATDVRWQKWPEAATFQGVIAKADQPDLEKLDVYDAPLRRNIEAGEPITRQALVPDAKGGNNFLAALIAPGMRAMAVSVKANTMAGGFIAPGDRVDVILSYAPRLSSDMQSFSGEYIRRYASETILSNIKVLAVDQDAKDAARQAKVAKTVTLEVDQEGAQILALAGDMGDITLALRRIGDTDPQNAAPPLTTDATTSDILKKLNDIAKKSQTSTNSIRVYSGPDIYNVPVRATPDNAGE